MPQITTREAGDVVRDGVEGIIVRPGDVEAIAAALEHLHRHPKVVEEMGRAARRRDQLAAERRALPWGGLA